MCHISSTGARRFVDIRQHCTHCTLLPCLFPHGGYISAAPQERAFTQCMNGLCLQAIASSLHRLQAELVAQARNVRVDGNFDTVFHMHPLPRLLTNQNGFLVLRGSHTTHIAKKKYSHSCCYRHGFSERHLDAYVIRSRFLLLHGFQQSIHEAWPYRGTSLTINRLPLGPYSRAMPGALW